MYKLIYELKNEHPITNNRFPVEVDMRFLSLSLIAFALLFTSVIVVAQVEHDYSKEALGAKYKPLNDEAEIAALCRDFMDNAIDIDVVRSAQNYWESVDEDGVRAYCSENVRTTPTARNKYLSGRVAATPVEKIKLGRDAIELEPDWAYGYRLVLATYANDLFDGDSEDEHYATLKKMLATDVGYFDKFISVDPNEVYAFRYLAQYQLHQKDYTSALVTMKKGEALEERWPAASDYAAVYAGLGRYDEALAVLTKQADENVKQGMDAEYRDGYIISGYTKALYKVNAVDQVIAYLKSADGWEADMSVLYDLACATALNGSNDQSLDFLSQAATAGWDKVTHTGTDSDLEPLRSDSRWETIMASIQTNWDKGAPKRKEEALAAQIDEESPNWSLPDVNGKMVSLADLKGKVIVLDFWATWCGPCKMSMPVIDEFVRTKAGKDVLVFSIDVWEKGKKKPAQYIKENDYAMTLLYGNDELAAEFGVRGIPFLCVIDRFGRIRYKETGYSEELGEKLLYWTEELLEIKSR